MDRRGFVMRAVLVGAASVGLVCVGGAGGSGGLWSGGEGAGGGVDRAGGVVVEAVSRASGDLALAFTVAGRVGEVLVEEGDAVEAGSVLMRLDGTLAALDVRLAEAAAGSDAKLGVARTELGLARTELGRVERLRERDAAATFEVERKRLEVERAEARVRLEEEQRARAALRLERARAVLREHELRSPRAGSVERVIVERGETVEALTPVVRVVDTTPLRIEAAVPTWRTIGVGAGDAVWVRLILEGESGWLRGEVSSLSSVADAGSDSRVVRVDMANDAGWPAGVRVEVRFDDPGAGGGA